MFEWLKEYGNFISTIANLGMLAVWIFYAQLLYNGYRRERRPRVLINKGISYADLDAHCLICNMSKEPIFIEAIFVDLVTSNGTYSAAATDAGEEELGEGEVDLPNLTRQGPLDSGSCIQVRRFRTFIQRAAEVGNIKLVDGQPEDPEIRLESLAITVVSIYGPEDNPFGVTRSFDLSCDDAGKVSIRPASIDTQLLNSRHEKKRIKRWLKDTL